MARAHTRSASEDPRMDGRYGRGPDYSQPAIQPNQRYDSSGAVPGAADMRRASEMARPGVVAGNSGRGVIGFGMGQGCAVRERRWPLPELADVGVCTE